MQNASDGARSTRQIEKNTRAFNSRYSAQARKALVRLGYGNSRIDMRLKNKFGKKVLKEVPEYPRKLTTTYTCISLSWLKEKAGQTINFLKFGT
ncbi:hypothetical protein C7B76_31905 [filamentous cyanobacterium CCP2]|nr:hypothetical protein C7B76_31905 [filamentous cyanobacterium CCP2]